MLSPINHLFYQHPAWIHKTCSPKRKSPTNNSENNHTQTKTIHAIEIETKTQNRSTNPKQNTDPGRIGKPKITIHQQQKIKKMEKNRSR